jgi:Uncharacterised protein conserved in bacteria (DUF2336)
LWIVSATRDDLPLPLPLLWQSLVGFVTERQWLGPEHAEYAAREACGKATLALGTETPYEELPDLVRHLCESDQLTADMLLRALLSGNLVLLEEKLAADVPADKVSLHLHERTTRPARCLSQGRAAGACLSSLRAGLAALREGYAIGDPGGPHGSSGASSSKCSLCAARRVLRRRCLPYCADSRWKRPAKKRGCSAMNWSPMSCRFTPCNSTKCGWWPEALFLPRPAAI